MEIIDGDLLDFADKGIIVHQVNCQGKMGSGVALQIKNRFRWSYLEYLKVCNEAENKEELMGECVLTQRENLAVAHLFGQLNYGRDGKCYSSYEAIEEGFRHLCKYAGVIDTVYLPYKMSCDRGGGDWDKVVEIIDRVSAKTSTKVIAVKYNK